MAMPITFCDKKMVSLSSGDINYNEWEFSVDGHILCVVHQGDKWTLLQGDYRIPSSPEWGEIANGEECIATFLTYHNLILEG